MQNNDNIVPTPQPGDQQSLTVGPAPMHPRADALDDAMESRLAAIALTARHWGVELERSDLHLIPGSPLPQPADLVGWVRAAGLWAKADHVKWRHLMQMQSDQPVVLLFVDGSAAVMTGRQRERNVVLLRDPRGSASDAPTAVDELRLNQLWAGEVILVRPERAGSPEDEPFDFGWILRLVMTEKSLLREIAISSTALTILNIVPILVIMLVIDKVLTYHAVNTLIFGGLMMSLIWIAEAIMTFTRHIMTSALGARLDTRLNLHVFNRLLALPLDYYETNPAGRIGHRVAQIYRVRMFITGTAMDTFLDFFMLFALVPLLFYIVASLTWFILGFSVLIALIVFAFLRPLRRVYGKVVAAEVEKATVMIETVHGIRTVKSLALEPQQRDSWDAKVANCSSLRLHADHLAAWPKALVLPLQRLAERGVLLIGAWMALNDPTALSTGAMVAVMVLGGRVAGPLVGLAKMMQDMEEIRAAVIQISLVLNNPTEVTSRAQGMRPKFAGAITFDNLTFTYLGSKTPALNKLTCEIPAGTMLGLVGRSGSGKSTVTRMLQGISRNYEGYLKIDGTELREIQLGHLRRSFGVVLQENFLFRGTVRDNIIASRPGLTMEDVVRAARMAGAEEFVERMPKGYETYIEEGSPNLSGGQRQRLAIARALISDPRLMILDEATSALDPESEALVNANLRRIAHGRTMVIVSHRLSSLIDCDLIMVLERGSIVDLAPHDVLLERCSIYRMLWHQQNRHLNKGQPPGPAEVKPALVQGD